MALIARLVERLPRPQVDPKLPTQPFALAVELSETLGDLLVKAGRKVGQFCRLKSGPPWSRRPAAKRAVGEWSGRVRLHADLTVLAKLACALSRTRAVPLAA